MEGVDLENRYIPYGSKISFVYIRCIDGLLKCYSIIGCLSYHILSLNNDVYIVLDGITEVFAVNLIVRESIKLI